MTHDYTRHGTITLFAALDALEGKLIARTEERHTHVEWLRFLNRAVQRSQLEPSRTGFWRHTLAAKRLRMWFGTERTLCAKGNGSRFPVSPLH
jgi:hypothetical protein